MRFTTPAAVLLAAATLAPATLMPAAPATAATRAAAPAVTFEPPAAVGTGTAVDVPVTVDNTGGTDQGSLRIRVTVTPLAGTARPLDQTLKLSYATGTRSIALSPSGSSLVGTTAALDPLAAGASAGIQLRITTEPTMYAPHVDEVPVSILVEALGSSGAVFAADGTPDRVALVEPHAEVSGWPGTVRVGVPTVFTATVTNTTPLRYALLRPAVVMYRAGGDQVLLERLDGDTWTPVAGSSSNRVWYYTGDDYPSLEPGASTSTTLRITFTDPATAGEQSYLYLMPYTVVGKPVAAEPVAFTIAA